MNSESPSRPPSRRQQIATEVALLLLCSSVMAFAQSPTYTIGGYVRDSTGAAVAGADVSVRSAHFTSSVKAGPEGHYIIQGVPDPSGTIEASARGFSSLSQKWSASSDPIEIMFTLKPLGPREHIVVSATRSEMRLADVPGSAIQLSDQDVAANPALTLDDMLRQVPGFTLFRRSSSRVANPTTQGVSLRGVGASGPSRALVLEDGIPIVDPFGGWVYWDRIPRAEISSVEVFRGGSSSLYGSDALGGVVQFLTAVPETPTMKLDISYGSENTPDLSFLAGGVVSRWDLNAAADLARTNGYVLVPVSQRGAVDTEANSEHATVDASLGYHLSETGRAFLRGTFFDESRNNGTPIQKNATGSGFGAAGINTALGAHDWLSARVFGQAQGYDQTFSAIAADRTNENLTDIQHVPSQALGGGAQWNHLLKNHTLIAGVDLEQVMGASDEQLFSSTSGAHFANNIAGGRQRSAGVFGQDIFRLGKWTFIAGARWDDWTNSHGNTVRISLPSGTPTRTTFSDRAANSFSPRISILRALTGNISVSLSGYRAFRAPTLNELYRSFRQGSITTNANSSLKAERSSGAEAGVRTSAFGNRLESRATAFWADIVDPITNATINATTRQRQNLGRTRSIGMELDSALNLTDKIQISGGYQYAHATVVDSAPALIGLSVPEVPRHQLAWEARYWSPARLMVSAEGRYSTQQFDDDLNTLRLSGYYVMDLFVGREFRHGLTFYAAAENLLNQRYAVALAPPVENLGPPILVRVGCRIDLPARSK